jgi:hypothetical protein
MFLLMVIKHCVKHNIIAGTVDVLVLTAGNLVLLLPTEFQGGCGQLLISFSVCCNNSTHGKDLDLQRLTHEAYLA